MIGHVPTIQDISAATKIQARWRGHQARRQIMPTINGLKRLQVRDANTGRECPIDMNTDVHVRNAAVTRCGHAYLADAILQWLQQHPVCPTCRGNVTHAEVIEDLQNNNPEALETVKGDHRQAAPVAGVHQAAPLQDDDDVAVVANNFRTQYFADGTPWPRDYYYYSPNDDGMSD
jgi:hypothetical protein